MMLALLFVSGFISSANAAQNLYWNQGPCANAATDCYPTYINCGNLTPSQPYFTCLCNLDNNNQIVNTGGPGNRQACCKGNAWCQSVNNEHCSGNSCTWFCDLNASSLLYHTCYQNISGATVSSGLATEVMMPVPASVALIFVAFFMGIILSYGVYKVAKIRKTYTSTAPQPLADDSQRSHEMEESSSPGLTENRRLTNQV